jgi:integrase
MLSPCCGSPLRPLSIAPTELQTLLGHASLDTTRRYLDATAGGLREVVRGHPGQMALRDHVRGSKS